MSDLRKYYDATAEETAKEWYPNTVLLPTLRELVALLPRRPRVLDLGCGAGYESMRLHSLGAEIVGIDFSPESIRIAKEKNPECRFMVADFLEIDESFGNFDGVFASGSLIHVPPEKMEILASRVCPRITSRGVFEMIVRGGQGKRVMNHIVKGASYERTVFFHSLEGLKAVFGNHGLKYLRDGALDSGLASHGWECHIFIQSQAPDS